VLPNYHRPVPTSSRPECFARERTAPAFVGTLRVGALPELGRLKLDRYDGRDSPAVNSLLGSLAPVEASRILPGLELVSLESRQVLFEQGQVITHVYFPLTTLISQLRVMNGRIVVETGAIGSEGMLGLPVFLGSRISDTLCRVLITGKALRTSRASFLKLVAANDDFREILGRYTAASLAGAVQLAACNLLHPLRQRCARTLLAIHDHVAGDDLLLTHEYLAQMLGVGRGGVTPALGFLQTRGIITNRRGVITILDRQRLEADACECAAIMRELAKPSR